LRFIILAGEIETKTKPLTSKLPGDLNASRRLPDVVGEKGSQQVQSQTIKNSISAILKSCQSFVTSPPQKNKNGEKRYNRRAADTFVSMCWTVDCVCLHCAPQIGQKYKNIKDSTQNKGAKSTAWGDPQQKSSKKIKKNTRSEWQTKSNKRQRQIANLTNRA